MMILKREIIIFSFQNLILCTLRSQIETQIKLEAFSLLDSYIKVSLERFFGQDLVWNPNEKD